jgi:hypothetical protein
MIRFASLAFILAVLGLPSGATAQFNCTSNTIGNSTYTNCRPQTGVDSSIPLQAGQNIPHFGPNVGPAPVYQPPVYQPVAPDPSVNCTATRIGGTVYTNCR